MSDSILFPGRESDPDTIEAVVGEAIGAGSVCWESLTGTGVFQDQRASQIVDEVVAWVKADQERALMPSEVDLNRLAQRFYEASGIAMPSMADKPLIVAGLRAVFEDWRQR